MGNYQNHLVISSKKDHTGVASKFQLNDLFSLCLHQLKILKIWRKKLVVAEANEGHSNSYRPISLLCVSYKILQRLVYARVQTIIDSLLPRDQAGFRRRKSTVNQFILLIENIQDFLSICRSDSGI